MLRDLILVLNCGSSSLKFSILNPKNEKKYLYGLVDRLYLPQSSLIWYIWNEKHQVIIGDNISHEQCLHFIIDKILSKQQKLFSKIQAVGHRVVHGGINLKKTVIIDDIVIEKIKKNIIFSPLHNPINLLGIYASLKYFPDFSKKNVAVFDTSFFSNLPEVSYLYAIPYDLYKNYGIRRYGAHGISHFYVTNRTSKILNIKSSDLNIITCHLGNGSSVSVIRNGICVDTSMGLTPLEGLVMGTRSGDIDPAIIFFMNKIMGLDLNQIEEMLIKKSGLLGLSNGITSDFRYFEKRYFIEEESKRIVNIFCHRLSKYISSYTSLLDGRLDAIVFTGGIGENSILVRKITLCNLSLLGIKIDHSLNELMKLGKSGYINQKNTIPVLVIPTNEELVIAQETMKLLK